MYRVTAEAVSGTNVYAGGKWLKCIGNKPVHVGERVWTDGRCVYGNYQESQQPPVIISVGKEVIPIVTTNGFYTFDKGKLTLVSPNEEYSFNILEDYHPVFVNNERAKSYFVNDYVLPSKTVCVEENNESETSCDVKCVIAANVDKSGNLSIIRINGFNLEIWENGEIVDTTDFEQLINEIKNATPKPTAPPLPQGDTSNPVNPWIESTYSLTTVHFKVNHTFIENKNNWAVYMTLDCQNIHEQYVGDISSESSALTYKHYSITNSGVTTYAGDTHESSWQYGDDPSFSEVVTIEPNSSQKLLLQDGYYFTEEVEAENSENNSWWFYSKRTVYSPDNKKIFTGLFERSSSIIFRKVKGSYLMAVNYDRRYFAKDEENLQTKLNLPYFLNGIFLLRQDKWEMLTDKISNEHYLNQQFRTLKEIKKWQNRVQEVSLD